MKKIFALVFLAAMANFVVGQEEEKPARKATPDDYKKLAKLGSYKGKVSVGPKSVTIKIDDSGYQKDLKWAQNMANPVQAKQAMLKVEQTYASSKWALGKEFELELAPKVVLLKTDVPFEYDEKGVPKNNEKEKAKLKVGNFYKAKIDDFPADAISSVTFGPMKDGKPVVTQIVVDNRGK